MSDWKTKIILAAGETTKPTGSRSTGFMQETDVYDYDVVAADGTKVGNITVEDHTAVKGFKRTVTVTQTDASGKTIVHESWNPPK
jgi:hypothetical protein